MDKPTIPQCHMFVRTLELKLSVSFEIHSCMNLTPYGQASRLSVENHAGDFYIAAVMCISVLSKGPAGGTREELLVLVGY